MTSMNSDVGFDTSLSESTSASSSSMDIEPNTSQAALHGLTPLQSLEIFGDIMTNFERKEIKRHRLIYFTGAPGIKKIDIVETQSFDDCKGNYRYVSHDHLSYRYEVLKAVGSGSFGMVLKCYDHKRQAYVAVKVVRNWPKVSRSALIEVDILSKLLKLRNHEGGDRLVRLLNYFDFRGHRCLVFELLGPSLYDALKKRKFKGFIPSDVKLAAKPILQALHFLRQNGILHCDLKPENILLVNDDFSNVKLIDFGSATSNTGTFYSYIQSRFYRAPEVLMQQHFGVPIDMWSFGCILVELITGAPVFAGENRFDQMTVIMELIGMPSLEFRRSGQAMSDYFTSDGLPTYCRRKKDNHESFVIVPEKSPKGNVRMLPGMKTWGMIFKGNADVVLIDLLNQCLVYDQFNRFKPSDALVHRWLLPPDIITIDDD